VNLSLIRKGIVLLAVPLMYQLALIGIFAWLQIRYVHVQRQSEHTKQVIAQNRAISAQMRELAATVTEAESGIRGYVITAKPEFRQPYDRAVQRIPGELDRLAELTRDDPVQTAQTMQIREKASAATMSLAQIEQLMKAGKQHEALAVADSDGKTRVNELRDQVAQFLDELATLLDAEELRDARRTAAVAQVQRSLITALLVGGMVAFGLTVLLALAFRRRLLQRFDVLVENTHRLADGRELIPPITGSDEITELDGAFRRMAEQLHGAEIDRRRSSKEIHQLNADLERRVHERTAQLADVNRDLMLKNQENELFVYSVSHDLRSPLVNLQGFSQELGLAGRDLRALLMQDGVPPEVQKQGLSVLEGNVAESIRFIQSAVRRLSTIIDALLRLSRAGRIDYQRQDLDTTAIVCRVAEAMHATAAAQQANIDVGDLPRLRGDAVAIEQVFANLVGNALNYLDPARPGRVEVGALPNPAADGLRICYVRDNGVGIPETGREKIFQAFHRLHPESAAGEGMGLTIVRRIVERHRGRIWVESQVGAGSTFFVALPAATGEAAKPGSRPDTEYTKTNDAALMLQGKGVPA